MGAQRTACRQQERGDQSRPHHPDATEGLGQAGHRQDRQSESAGRAGDGEAGQRRTNAEGSTDGGQDRLRHVEQPECGEAGGQHRRLEATHFARAGVSPTLARVREPYPPVLLHPHTSDDRKQELIRPMHERT